ncbi:FtsX-like permease family protein [Neobacillus sp. OS1-2]|uniref:ABC transporter permease n=1 Tax=Neobacillus sp. OS1-2 TaxID=3070680 RepID=UPI0027E00E2B|nr:FtsX-like permease family protein [Neobacillus sp. OS1-2]WML42059.1 FtsX-like permease family protein [Neobacillus sp. OS1-2]
MISFILKNWMRQKRRFFLMMIGALLISGGLSTLIGLSETNKGTVINSLQKKWKASYDIVVRPKGTKSITEQVDLFDPNYLSGLAGGISLEDYEKIKGIPDIETAAPISMIGFSGYVTNFKKMDVKEPGIYRLTETTTDYNGLNPSSATNEHYFSRGMYDLPSPNISKKYGITGIEENLSSFTNVLLAAVDPVQEAKLVGLDKAMLPIDGKSQYFSKDDMINSYPLSELGFEGITAKETIFPVIISNQSFLDQTFEFKIEKLDIPYGDSETRQKSLEVIEKNGGEEYLKTLPTIETKKFSYNSNEGHQLLMESLSGVDLKTRNTKSSISSSNVDLSSLLREQTSSLKYRSIESPFPERWNHAFQVIPYEDKTNTNQSFTYRKPQLVDLSMRNNPRLSPYFIGFYDPKKLDVSMDPENELPMETYKSPSAKWVLNSKDQPVNPPKTMNPTSNIYGYLMQPPTMLTTIEAAKHILGDNPISAIRIKVKDVNTLNEESQEKLKLVAKKIEQQTGLETDITLGSSPQPILINIPKVRNHEALGWIEQSWIKIGAAINIFQETKLGYTGIIICNILVAMIYVFSTSLVSFLSRKREFAILLAIGWKPRQLKNILMMESLLIGVIVTFVTLLVQLILGFRNVAALSISQAFLITFFVLLIYIIGPLGPIHLVNQIQPSHVMRTGEISVLRKRVLRTNGLLSMVFNSVIGRLNRNLVSIIAIALPTSLLILFIYVSFRLKGVLYTSWLGQYVSLEVGTPHYVAVAISLIISILTTSEILWQNIKERRNEISLLKALGWKNKNVRLMVLIEGAAIGFLGGLAGGLISLGIIYFMYGPIPIKELWLPLITCLSPVLIGMAGAWIPSRVAMKMEPIEGMRGIGIVKSDISIDI